MKDKLKDKMLSTLGICKKAGKLVMGYEAVAEAAAAGTIALILLCDDLSPKSGKEIAFTAGKHGTRVVTTPIKMEEIQHWLGKRSGIIGVSDQGLANTLNTHLQMCRTEEETLI